MGDVVDYSWARPSAQRLRERGYTGAMRYLSHEPKKNLSIGERDRLWAEGIAIGLVWETTAGRPLAGYNAGQQDAREANRQADVFGWPMSTPIAYAVDIDPTRQIGLIGEYFRGAVSVGLRPVGIYGAYSVIEAAPDWGVTCFWQCAGWSGSGAGSGGTIHLDDGSRRRVSRHACLYQDIAETRAPGEDHNHVLGHVAFLYHPDQQAQPHLKEMVMANGVKLPDIPESGQTVWLPTTDGVGRPRRVALGFPHGTSAALESGVIDGVVELTGDVGREFWNYWIEAAPIVDEWQEAAAGVASREQLVAAVNAALAGVDAPGLPATFADQIVDKLAARLAD